MYNIFLREVRIWGTDMGRTKTFDRDEAVQTVMNEIWKNGYEASSVKALSEKLGLTRSSFYHSFDSREALFLEVLQAYAEQAPDYSLANINSDSQVLKEICTVFKKACFARANDPEHKGCLAVNSVLELVGTNPTLGPVMSNVMSMSLERFKSLLRLAVDVGELEDKDIQSKAIAIKNLLVGINVMGKIIHDAEELWHSTRISLEGLGIYKNSFKL